MQTLHQTGGKHFCWKLCQLFQMLSQSLKALRWACCGVVPVVDLDRLQNYSTYIHPRGASLHLSGPKPPRWNGVMHKRQWNMTGNRIFKTYPERLSEDQVLSAMIWQIRWQ